MTNSRWHGVVLSVVFHPSISINHNMTLQNIFEACMIWTDPGQKTKKGFYAQFQANFPKHNNGKYSVPLLNKNHCLFPLFIDFYFSVLSCWECRDKTRCIDPGRNLARAPAPTNQAHISPKIYWFFALIADFGSFSKALTEDTVNIDSTKENVRFFSKQYFPILSSLHLPQQDKLVLYFWKSMFYTMQAMDHT